MTEKVVNGSFAGDILDVADGEPILGIVIGDMGWGDYGSENKPDTATVKGKLISWDEAIPYLNYQYSRGYGAPDCQAITAWTETKVIFIVQYDGSTSVNFVPRNPIDHMPDMPGG